MTDHDKIPRHVAVIMDGNGRWARKRGMPRYAGHRSGVGAVRRTVEIAAERGVGHLTLFAFSSENWQRPRDEIRMLMKLFLEALQREVDELDRNDVQLGFIGNRQRLQPELQALMASAERQTEANAGLKLRVAIAYGGRWDLVQAARRLAEKAAAGEIEPPAIDDADIAAGLALADAPEPDLLIRTGGEQRISNFLLWQLAYAELWFTDVLWPDFEKSHFDEALAFFAGRERRYGHTGEQVKAVVS
ncbi:MAG: polyprenyl diphosphate synthase [Woeseiaceae bacterium]|nr:polyprenyl diphosphate synthase [Woeseiaceae bacterium]